MPTTILTNGVQFPDSSVQTVASNIKSVQSIFAYPKGSLTGDYGSTAVNITISSVNTSKAIILYPSAVESSTYSSYRLISAKFINSTTVQFCCDNISAQTPPSIRFQVVEFQ
jgi:hypothetical protein